MKRWRTALAVAACVVLGVAVVLSVRDGGGQASADEAFVDSLCAAAIEPSRTLLELIDDVTRARASPGYRYGWYPLYFFALTAREAALEYRRSVRAIRAPDTPAGAKAAPSLDYIGQQPLDLVMEEVSRIRMLPRNLSLLQSIRSLNRMPETLTFAFPLGGGSSILLAVAPELMDEFESAESCKELDAALAAESDTD